MRRIVFGVVLLRVPTQRVDELGERVAVRLQFVVPETGIPEVGQAEVADEAPRAPVEGVEVISDEFGGVGGGDRHPLRRRWPGGPGGDPLLQRGQFRVARPHLLADGGHRTVGDAFVDRRRVRLAGDDLLAVGELGGVEDEVEAPFHRTVLTVAAVAMRLQNSLRLRREVIGERARPQREPGDCGEKEPHAAPPNPAKPHQ